MVLFRQAVHQSLDTTISHSRDTIVEAIPSIMKSIFGPPTLPKVAVVGVSLAVQRTLSRPYLTCNFFVSLHPAPHNVLGSALVVAKQSVRELPTRAPAVFSTQPSGAKPVLPLRPWAGAIGTGQGCCGPMCGQHWHAWEVGVAAAGGRPRGAVRHGLPVWTVKREHQARPGPASPTSLTAQRTLASLADPAKLERNGSHLTFLMSSPAQPDTWNEVTTSLENVKERSPTSNSTSWGRMMTLELPGRVPAHRAYGPRNPSISRANSSLAGMLQHLATSKHSFNVNLHSTQYVDGDMSGSGLLSLIVSGIAISLLIIPRQRRHKKHCRKSDAIKDPQKRNNAQGPAAPPITPEALHPLGRGTQKLSTATTFFCNAIPATLVASPAGVPPVNATKRRPARLATIASSGIVTLRLNGAEQLVAMLSASSTSPYRLQLTGQDLCRLTRVPGYDGALSGAFYRQRKTGLFMVLLNLISSQWTFCTFGNFEMCSMSVRTHCRHHKTCRHQAALHGQGGGGPQESGEGTNQDCLPLSLPPPCVSLQPFTRRLQSSYRAIQPTLKIDDIRSTSRLSNHLSHVLDSNLTSLVSKEKAYQDMSSQRLVTFRLQPPPFYIARLPGYSEVFVTASIFLRNNCLSIDSAKLAQHDISKDRPEITVSAAHSSQPITQGEPVKLQTFSFRKIPYGALNMMYRCSSVATSMRYSRHSPISYGEKSITAVRDNSTVCGVFWSICFLILNVARELGRDHTDTHASLREHARMSEKLFGWVGFGTLRRLTLTEPTHRLHWITTQDSPSPPEGAAARRLGRSLNHQRSAGGKVGYGDVLLERMMYWLHLKCLPRGELRHGSNADSGVEM
ncbi:uncharacterized protein CLUP02_08535 [Colletotrichum lupini]|uniref:Uncharacterized protein n=1 Tax=Colletotrichum lupini TaxID=145971 RepID=A0A9Q8WHQ9_9PEZI|nr:uncharacterized protein CLUP02_08535 [Colletotrichum lupini]UQC83045.1 hypothetical protein CLUP02_08535 [Colletotrichum lupini]